VSEQQRASGARFAQLRARQRRLLGTPLPAMAAVGRIVAAAHPIAALGRTRLDERPMAFPPTMVHDSPPASKVTLFRAKTTVSETRHEPGSDPAYWSQQMALLGRERDTASFMRIYDHFAPKLHRYLLSVGEGNAQAEELVQEAMLRVWRHCQAFDARQASLSTWIFQIVRNLRVDRIRRRAQASVAPIDPALLHTELSQEPEAYVDNALLAQAIDRLAPTEARLVRMSYLESKSHHEISQELEMPLGTVKSTLRRSFQKLSAALRGSA